MNKVPDNMNTWNRVLYHKEVKLVSAGKMWWNKGAQQINARGEQNTGT